MRLKLVKEHQDGSATFGFTLSKRDEINFRRIAKIQKRRYSQKFIKDSILEALTRGVHDTKTK
jgi:hypothetical protein